MKRTQTTLYIKSTDELRPFLELAGYGCYSRRQMKRLLPKGGTYDKRIEFLNTCLDSDYWHYTQQGKERRFAFHGDAYHPKVNGLLPIFSMKSLDLQWLLCYLAILSVLNNQKDDTYISYSRLQDKVMQLLYDLLLPRLQSLPFKNQTNWKKELAASPQKNNTVLQLALQLYHQNWNSQIRRRLHDLVEIGWICTISKGNEKQYALNKKDGYLTVKEKQQLAQVLPLFAGTTFFGLPGWYLTKFYSALPALQYYQIRYGNMLRISNDSQLYLLLRAIREHQKIIFTYRGKAHAGYPVQVYTDAYQREYLRLYKENRISTYRVHRMNQIQLTTHKSEPVEQKLDSKKQQIILRLHYESRQDFHRLTDHIWYRFPDVEISQVRESSAQCRLKTADTRNLLPWIRTLYPQVEVITDTTSKLRARSILDLKEALANYGISI